MPRTYFDFDTIIIRRGTDCIKYDRRPELDPLWGADIDFASASGILEALHRRVDYGIFGYADDRLNAAIVDYLRDCRSASVPLEHIVHLGGFGRL